MYIPNKLYHATIKSRIPSIKRYGLGGKIPKLRFWDYDETEYANVTVGCFLDSDVNCAFDYVESSDYYDGDGDDIVVFEIDTNDLDLSKLAYDYNDEKNIDNIDSESHSFFYKGIIPYTNLRKLKNNEIFENINNMKKDNKKALYESIMTSVAKEVKKVLNERQILSEEEKLSRRIGNKLSFRIYGGDWNDILDAMENNNPEEAREICRAINRSYRTRIFSSNEIEFMINNWELCKESARKIRKEKIEKFYHTGILPEH